jgi:glutamate carboxypeptidase
VATLDQFTEVLSSWCAVSSFTDDVAGVRRTMEQVVDHLGGDEVAWHELPPRRVVDERGEVVEVPVGPAAVVGKGPADRRRVLLCGHCDTVHPAAWPMTRAGTMLRGPGVADMKGGLLVMAEAARRCAAWTAVLTPDEEVGNPSSAALLGELAKRHKVGLVFEPPLEGGALAGARCGSAAFDLVLRGRSAHVGRNFAEGRSAIHLACEAVGVLDRLNVADGVTVNVGAIDGGGPSNVVADRAVVRINVRVVDAEKQQAIENDLRRLVQILGRREGVTAALHGGFTALPKPEPSALLDRLKQIDPTVTWQPTGGVCEGSILQRHGLPNLDTLGITGGNIHTRSEWCDLSSIKPHADRAAKLIQGSADA